MENRRKSLGNHVKIKEKQVEHRVNVTSAGPSRDELFAALSLLQIARDEGHVAHVPLVDTQIGP